EPAVEERADVGAVDGAAAVPVGEADGRVLATADLQTHGVEGRLHDAGRAQVGGGEADAELIGGERRGNLVRREAPPADGVLPAGADDLQGLPGRAIVTGDLHPE